MGLINEKTRGRKSRDTVSLKRQPFLMRGLFFLYEYLFVKSMISKADHMGCFQEEKKLIRSFVYTIPKD
jgi:hypothetical protein